jgi:hypothetical protein
MNLAAAADELRAREFSRLAATVVPTLEALRLLSARQLRATVATMLQRLGYELVTSETAAELVTTKDEKKYLIAFGPAVDPAPIPLRELSRLRAAVVAANAAAGFFVTTRGFAPDAEAYGATAPLKLVDGPKLVASIKHSMQGVTMPESYQAKCRQCGEIVQHTLARAEAIPCRNGHPVPPTIARGDLLMPKPKEGAISSYKPPHVHSRYEVRAHNAKYQAKMRRRKPKPPSAAPEPGDTPGINPDPFI